MQTTVTVQFLVAVPAVSRKVRRALVAAQIVIVAGLRAQAEEFYETVVRYPVLPIVAEKPRVDCQLVEQPQQSQRHNQHQLAPDLLI